MKGFRVVAAVFAAIMLVSGAVAAPDYVFRYRMNVSASPSPGAEAPGAEAPGAEAPAAFAIPPVEGAELQTWVESDLITPTGAYGTLEISATSGGQVSVANGPWTSQDIITAGQSFRARIMSSANYSTKVSTKVSIGNTAASFQVTTKNPPDTTPDPFSFRTIFNAEFNTVYESEEIIPVGYEAPTSVSAKVGEVSINGGPWVKSGIIEPGQSIKARGKSADKYATNIPVRVTIGGVEGTFNIRTKNPPDTTPDQFSIPWVYNADLNVWVESDPITPMGYDAPTSISANNGGEVSVDNGPWTSSTTISPGQSFRVRRMSPSNYNSYAYTNVTVGGITAEFRVITLPPPDTRPDPFEIPSVSGVEPDTWGESVPVTPTGYDAPAKITASDSGQVSVEDGPWVTETTISPGQSFKVRIKSSSEYNRGVSTIVRIGSSGVEKAYFYVYTRMPPDTRPDPFEIPSVSGVEPDTWGESVPVTPTGYDAPAKITASDSGQVSVEDGPWVTETTISPGQSFKVRIKSSSEYNRGVSTIVRIGSSGVEKAYFYVYTRMPPDQKPDPFSIPAVYDVEPDTWVVSEPVTPIGYEGTVTIRVQMNGGEISVDNGPWMTEGSITIGQSFRVRVKSPNGYNKSVQTYVSVGGPLTGWHSEWFYVYTIK